MSDNMAAPSDAGIIASIWAAVGALLAVLSFWTKFVTDRISTARRVAEKARGVAENALQEAVEAKQESHETRESLEEMIRDLHDKMERTSRDVGESNAAIREKITQVELFMRDNFVRQPEFMAAMAKIEAGQLRTEAKIDQLACKMPPY